MGPRAGRPDPVWRAGIGACAVALALLLVPTSASRSVLGAGGLGLVAYVSLDSDCGLGCISTIDPIDGTGGQLIAGSVGDPAWSADGTRLAIALTPLNPLEAGAEHGLALTDALGQNRVRVTTELGDRFPAWSPDGTRLTFREDPGRIAVVNADGSGRTTLRVGGDASTWSPDGQRIAFRGVVVVPPGRTDSHIWVMAADGSDQRALTAGEHVQELTPSWSPDGATIAYAGRRTQDERTDTVMPEDGIYVMNADGSGQRQLTHGLDGHPTWSADGAHIAFDREERPGELRVYVADADGAGVRAITTGTGKLPSWQPVAAAPVASAATPAPFGPASPVPTGGPDLVIIVGAGGLLLAAAGIALLVLRRRAARRGP